MNDALDAVFRSASGRIIAALAGRFRDLDLAEEALAEACARAATRWSDASPADPAAWLYRVAERVALDRLRRQATRDHALLDAPDPDPGPEDMLADANPIPDERLALIFTCCHPAINVHSRTALTLRLVCGIPTEVIARAFLLPEATLAQRLVRAKTKIARAGIAYAVPGPGQWRERLDAVLSTIEVAYAKAHEDAAGEGVHAGFAPEMLSISGTLATMLPDEAEVHALAATIRFAEARRPARLDADGLMIPLADQDPARWSQTLIADARRYMARAIELGGRSARVFAALIHAEWCARPSLAAPAPWPAILTLYDALQTVRDDMITRLNRAVALAEVAGPATALEEVDALAAPALADFLPYHAVRADLLARLGLREEAISAYDRALALDPAPAEARWLTRRRDRLVTC